MSEPRLTSNCDCQGTAHEQWCHNNPNLRYTNQVGVYDVMRLDISQACTMGRHEWLPWLRISPDLSLPSASWVTRCVHCQRTEQWDV